MAPGLNGIDWRAPWLAPLKTQGESVAKRACEGLPLHEALNRCAASPVRFVPQADLPEGEPYEGYIFACRQCPTRDNLHDFFNGLCWLHFPETKTRLNALQAAEIARTGIQPLRGPVRDALTVFDENAAFLQAPPAVWQALRERAWTRLFVDLRAEWAKARLVLFGHALLEKLVSPYKGITAHVYLGQPPMDSLASLDAWVARDLTPEKLATKPFTPLPVLGVPGWWPNNASPGFYADPQVFRPPASHSPSVEFPEYPPAL